ncbi:hypothetical protein [Escherichia coli]|uniref:hypothetical protein n=1 Tax=Escherichia coli TaxID=562 RepID=UPI003F4B18E0
MTQHSIRFPVAFPVAALNAQVSAVGDPNAIKMYTLSNPSLVSVTLITVRGCYGKFSWERSDTEGLYGTYVFSPSENMFYPLPCAGL